MERICRLMRQPPPDVRALVRQVASTTASHEAGQGVRVTVEQLLELYSVNEAIASPAPQAIGIVDDVLTAGTHYRAMHSVLAARFPNVPIIGLFRSEEHTSELQSLMRISYAVFCLQNKRSDIEHHALLKTT